MRVLIAAVLALSLGGAAAAADRALIVGINSYPYLTKSGVPVNKDLTGAVKDAQRMRRLLSQKFGFAERDIKLLTDRQATRAAILAEFQGWLIEGTGPGDRVYFHFSGHGLTARDADGDEADGIDEFIAPHDIRGDLTDGNVTNAIRDDEIARLIAALEGRRVVIVSDSCFSGTISRGGAEEEHDPAIRTLTPEGPVGLAASAAMIAANKTETRSVEVEPAAVGGSLLVWTAASATQLAWDLPGGEGGVFTTEFVKALSGGDLQAAQIFERVTEASKSYCETNPRCKPRNLTPTLESEPIYLGLPLFALGPAPEAAPPPAEVAEATLSHANAFALTLRIREGARLKLGQTIKIEVASGGAGRLFLFDQSAGGALTQIFPNAFTLAAGKDGTIAAGETLLIPDDYYKTKFTANTSGPSVLLAVVAPPGLDLADLPKEGNAFDLAKPDAFISALAQRLRAPALSADPAVPNGSHAWAYASFAYEVE